MKISVFLDDYRECPHGHVPAENIDDCFSLLRDFDIDHLSLDYDLVSKTRNGLMLVRLMVEHQLFADRITIHSANSVGSKAMYNFLRQAQNDLRMPRSIKVIVRPLPIIF